MYGYRKVTYSRENCLNIVSKQCNAIPMGLSKQKSSTHTRKQVLLLKTLAKQRNAISMGLAKQKFSIETRRNLEHIPGSK